MNTTAAALVICHMSMWIYLTPTCMCANCGTACGLYWAGWLTLFFSFFSFYFVHLLSSRGSLLRSPSMLNYCIEPMCVQICVHTHTLDGEEKGHYLCKWRRGGERCKQLQAGRLHLATPPPPTISTYTALGLAALRNHGYNGGMGLRVPLPKQPANPPWSEEGGWWGGGWGL